MKPVIFGLCAIALFSGALARAQSDQHDGPLLNDRADRSNAKTEESAPSPVPSRRARAVDGADINVNKDAETSKPQADAQPIEDEKPLTANVNVVNIMASVRDKHSGLVPNLNKEDFELFEDGKQQTIKYFSRESNLPLTIGLLIDVSRSQERLIDIEQRAGSAFLDAVLRPKDEAFIMSFGADTELLQDITSSKNLLHRGLDNLKPNFGFSGINAGPVPTATKQRGTVLYDAIYLASTDRLAKEAGRKVIVVITDGDDEGSDYTIKKAIEAAQKADVAIYSIYYVDRGFYMQAGYGFGGGGRGYLSQMSGDTGGHVYDVGGRDTLDRVFNQLQDEMRTQYSLAYSPTHNSAPGTFHKLEIRTKDRALKVQARKGYYTSANEGS